MHETREIKKRWMSPTQHRMRFSSLQPPKPDISRGRLATRQSVCRKEQNNVKKILKQTMIVFQTSPLAVWRLLPLIAMLFPLTATVAQEMDQNSPEFVDLNNKCEAWASDGECATNSGYMLMNCAKSCGEVGVYADDEDDDEEFMDCWWNYDDDGNEIDNTHIRPGVRYSSALDVGDYVPIVDELHSYADPPNFNLLGQTRFTLVFPSFSPDIQTAHPLDEEFNSKLQVHLDPQEVIVVDYDDDMAFRRLFTTDGLDCNNEEGVLDTSTATSPHLLVQVGLNMKIVQKRWFETIVDLEDCSAEDSEPTLRSTPDEPYAPPPPILVVPNAIDPSLAQELIDLMDAERAIENNTDLVVDDWSGKRRNTIFLQARDNFTERIDDKLSKSVYPEIEKVFFYQVNSREDWRIGRYTGENKGIFASHRDTKEENSYRRFAISVLLNDEYEGGGLSFPEYSNKIIDVPRYSAVVFPGTLIHEVKPIQVGLRYVIIGFLFNSADEPSGRKSYRVETGRDTRGIDSFNLGMKNEPWTYEEAYEEAD